MHMPLHPDPRGPSLYTLLKLPTSLYRYWPIVKSVRLYFCFFFSTIKPRVEWYKSLCALHTSPSHFREVIIRRYLGRKLALVHAHALAARLLQELALVHHQPPQRPVPSPVRPGPENPRNYYDDESMFTKESLSICRNDFSSA